MIKQKILALDFDGVICNGLEEYFQSSQKCYQKIWSEIPDQKLREYFYQLRPVIEYGWEMPVLLRALILNYSPLEILDHWLIIRDKIVKLENINPQNLIKILDQVRDEWTNHNLDDWLSIQTSYQGIVETLQNILNSEILLYIISTKEGRFIKQILAKFKLKLKDKYLIGKECKRPKSETLRLIIEEENIDPAEIYFIEDRLDTLELIEKQEDLEKVSLFLADWGYNTESMRNFAKNHHRIKLLSLAEFCQDFAFIS